MAANVGDRNRNRGVAPAALRFARAAATTVVLVAWAPGPLRAQEEILVLPCQLAERNGTASAEAVRHCALTAQAVEILQARLGLAAMGGNPVPGAASTLGMRIGTLPRLSIAGRVTGVAAEAPPILDRGATEGEGLFLTAAGIEAAVGVFEGFSPAPTIGGVGSVDLVAGAGLLLLPEDEGFRDGSAFTWGVGARLGVLRESFTVPGISLTGSYRQVGEVTYGDPALGETDAFFTTDFSVLSLRATVGKQLFLVGVTAGAGYDNYGGDVRFGATGPDGERLGPFPVEGFDDDRFLAFLNLSWTFLVLSVSGELGWQGGGGEVPAALPAVEVDAGDGAFFGALAVRLSI